ncbi:MAG TPA: aminopeptidase P N-terminal domain-containing protein [Polyangiaceae bacterium]|nr:aminopeptidase P N-terminal domain-containing protein [Polyangiaceae bacterium]
MHNESEFQQRRERVLAAIHPGVLVIPAAPLAIRNNDVEHEYRQDSDFFYLTGFDEPESVLVLNSQSEQPFTLFVRPRDPEREVWDGARAGVEGAVGEFGANVAFTIGDLAQKLPDAIQNTDRLFYRLGKNRSFDDTLLAALDRVRARARLGVTCPTSIVDAGTVVHEARLKKSERELTAMRRAIDITRDAHVAAMAGATPGMYEYEVEAILRGVFRRFGSERPAYSPIVGSGPNATVLHYHRNDRRMEEGDLLLIDAGCEFDYYAADVTRTFPVSGRFTNAQRTIYQLVLDAQLASIELTRAGRTFDEVHAASVEVITRGLCELGIIEGPLETAISELRYKPYYMHKTSHYLGMDVHDVGAYFVAGKPRLLEPGMVITVEPGIYIANNAQVAQEYRGIGVRIEDDVLVTDGAPAVLSEAIPKRVDEIERVCSRAA